MSNLISQLTGEHFVGGQWLPGEGEPLSPENPGLEQTQWQGAAASQQQVDKACRAARIAFDDWSLKSFAEREAVVRRYQALVREHAESLALAIHLETGKPLWESKTEVATMVGKVDLSVTAYHDRTGFKDNSNAAVPAQLAHRPQGVLAVLGPYNFPGHLPNGHIVPALLAGNCVVFKPSEYTPAVAELMMRLWCDAGLPAGVLNLLQGAAMTGRLLSEHQELDGLLFTGSSSTGARLHQAFAGKPEKILALEMGGNNPLVVTHVADQKACVYAIIQSAFVSAGQRCTCARRLILLRNESNERLLTELLEATARIKVGFNEDNFIGPVINSATADRLLSAQSHLIELGARPLLTMAKLHESKPLLSPAIIDVTEVRELPDDEYFGPLLQVIWVDDLVEATRVANWTRFGLSAGLLSDSDADWAYFYPRARAGIVNYNRPITGASGAAPFGGVGASGNHRPSAFYAADYCAHPVASVLDAQVQLPNTLSPGVQL